MRSVFFDFFEFYTDSTQLLLLPLVTTSTLQIFSSSVLLPSAHFSNGLQTRFDSISFCCCHVSFWPKFENSRRQRCVCAMCQTNYYSAPLSSSESTSAYTNEVYNENNNSNLMGQPDHDRFDPINNCLHEIYAKETNEIRRSLPFLGNLFAIENCVDLFIFSSLSLIFF